MNKKAPSKLAQLLDVFSVSSRDEDVALMKKLQAGHLEAFETLYMKYRTPLYSYFLGHTRDTAKAEDFLQETFSKLIEKRESFRFESKFSTWLWTMGRNTMLDHYRSADFRYQESLGDDGDDTLVSELSGPEEQIMLKSEEQALKACLEELATAQKDAVLLRSHGELAYEDIARELSTTVSAVKSLLVRAKEKLLQCLKRGGHA